MAASWLSPPQPLPLRPGEVHVWRAWLECPAEQRALLADSLSTAERDRAGRFHSEADRDRFVVARGGLRAILGHYLGVAAAEIHLSYGPHGKPHLAQSAHGLDLRFNLAHSHNLALYAFTAGCDLGVDLEAIRPLADADDIAARFFSARERAAYLALPAAERLEAFYRGWVRKEAYLKALGDGLARPLAGFSVSLGPGEPARLLEVEGDPAETERWSLAALDPAPGYAAALAVEGQPLRLVCWQFGLPPPAGGAYPPHCWQTV